MRAVINIFLLITAGVLLYIYGPVINAEIRYTFNQAFRVKYVLSTEQVDTFEKPLTPINMSYSIVIPKIGAVAPIIDNVDPANKFEYLKSLKSGIAHAVGTANPGEVGNVFLFAHADDTFYNINTYNADFFLIGKLEKGDLIDIFYKNALIKYAVYDKKIIDSTVNGTVGNVNLDEKTLTLQTDYPPGTSFQRLLIFARQNE